MEPRLGRGHGGGHEGFVTIHGEAHYVHTKRIGEAHYGQHAMDSTLWRGIFCSSSEALCNEPLHRGRKILQERAPAPSPRASLAAPGCKAATSGSSQVTAASPLQSKELHSLLLLQQLRSPWLCLTGTVCAGGLYSCGTRNQNKTARCVAGGGLFM